MAESGNNRNDDYRRSQIEADRQKLDAFRTLNRI
jgi:hypothetical protein